MAGSLQAVFMNQRSFVVSGSQSFTCAGTFCWIAPTGVTSVSVVAVGAGGVGLSASCGFVGGGGGLGWKNNITVVPGNAYTVVVTAPANTSSTPVASSYFISVATVSGQGGRAASTSTGGGCYVGTGGGNGGTNGPGGAGGGGAGGYTGRGGNSSYWCYGVPCCGIPAQARIGNAAAGAGGGGGGSTNNFGGGAQGGGGGGVGLFGLGASGNGGSASPSGATCGGCGGSGGTRGQNASSYTSGNGGVYGGGAGRWCNTGTRKSGGGGAVRIVWPGTTRQFPSTNVGLP